MMLKTPLLFTSSVISCWTMSARQSRISFWMILLVYLILWIDVNLYFTVLSWLAIVSRIAIKLPSLSEAADSLCPLWAMFWVAVSSSTSPIVLVQGICQCCISSYTCLIVPPCLFVPLRLDMDWKTVYCLLPLLVSRWCIKYSVCGFRLAKMSASITICRYWLTRRLKTSPTVPPSRSVERFLGLAALAGPPWSCWYR